MAGFPDQSDCENVGPRLRLRPLVCIGCPQRTRWKRRRNFICVVVFAKPVAEFARIQKSPVLDAAFADAGRSRVDHFEKAGALSLDLRTVAPTDDDLIAAALARLG